MKTIENYIEENKERFLKELFELIRIPSISSEVEHKADMYKCAEKWKSLLLEAGADKAEVYETKRSEERRVGKEFSACVYLGGRRIIKKRF